MRPSRRRRPSPWRHLRVRTQPCRRAFGVSGALRWRPHLPSAPRAYQLAPVARPLTGAGYLAEPGAPSPVHCAAPTARRRRLALGRTWNHAARVAPRLPCPLRLPGKRWLLRRRCPSRTDGCRPRPRLCRGQRRLEARRPAREGNKRPGRREVTSIDPHGEFFHT
jgi:hypothetical protein